VRKGHVKRIEGVEAKLVPRARKRPLTDLEKAKAALGLSAAPTTLPCRDRCVLLKLFLCALKAFPVLAQLGYGILVFRNRNPCDGS
jgi:hypothetical protein